MPPTRRSLPSVHVVPTASPKEEPGQTSQFSESMTNSGKRESRAAQIEVFLQSRSWSSNSQKAYRLDLQRFLEWTDLDWTEVTSRHLMQYKQYLMQQDPVTGKRAWSDATVIRSLGTLQKFYDWMLKSGQLDRNPVTAIEKPKPKEPEAKHLSEKQLAAIWEATATSRLPERNLALVVLLLHGLKASEACRLNVQDYEGDRLQVQQDEVSRCSEVPLSEQGKSLVNAYLEWRQSQGEVLQPDSPLFVSHSNRNRGQRITYDAVRKTLDAIERATGLTLHAYQFRHTFATDLVLQGLDPRQAMNLIRHKSFQSFRRYLKAIDPTITGISTKRTEEN